MTRLLAAFILMITLAGCVTDPSSATQGLYYAQPLPPIAETEPPEAAYDPGVDARLDTEALISTQPGEAVAEDLGTATSIAPPPTNAMLEQQRAACARDGGRLLPRGTGFFACVFQTGDSGRQCDEASDCEGLCLARSRSCAPFRPLFGCQQVFTQRGRVETLCTD